MANDSITREQLDELARTYDTDTREEWVEEELRFTDQRGVGLSCGRVIVAGGEGTRAFMIDIHNAFPALKATIEGLWQEAAEAKARNCTNCRWGRACAIKNAGTVHDELFLCSDWEKRNG